MIKNLPRPWTLGLALCAVLAAPAAQTTVNPYAPDRPEKGSVEAIAGFTTEARFGNPWVAYVPASETVPSPTRYLGHVAGAEGELTGTAKIYGYFRALAEATPRVRVQVIGRSEEGRDILIAAVADEEGIRGLDRLKAATAALADPRKTSAEAAEALIASARPIYYLNAGLHSTETGSPEMVMELAYRLAVSEQPMIKKIRSEVVVLINPVSEPDGRDKAVEWFYRYLKGKKDYDRLPPSSPPYWGKYVFHDNNRDTHQQALESSRAVTRMFFDFHPTVIHDLHESIPLLQTWNGTGPWNANLDPILINEFFAMAFAEIGALTSLGMPGVWTWGFGEGWGHHYLDSFAVNHNSMGRGYETFGNGSAETMERILKPNEERYVNRPVTSREWYRPLPPPKKFRWSLRDNTNYMESGCLAILDYAAKNAKGMLRDFYRKGYNSWQKGVKGGPFAFAIPEDQGDRRRVAQMVGLLQTQGIEVSRAAAPFKVDEGAFPAGTYVVKLDQPYRNYAMDLLLPQEFPADTPYEPYDDVSWALPVHYGVETKRIDDAKIKDAKLDPLPAGFDTPGKVNGLGPVFFLKDTGQEALLAVRNRLADFKVEIAEKAFKTGLVEYPAGSWILPDQKGLAEALKSTAAELGVDFESAAAVPDVPRHESRVPRLAVWHTWADTESVGWVRYVLDREKIAYSYISDDAVRAGRLAEKYDIILFGHNYLGLQDQILGIDKKYSPMPYTKTKETPSLGTPDATDDITGGIGWAGLANLEKYLADGGLLITLGNGSTLPLEGGLVRDVYRKSGPIYSPGSELRVKFTRPDHPLAYGFPAVTSVFRTALPVYDVPVPGRRNVVLQWGTKLRSEDREETGSDAPKAKDVKDAAKKDEPKMLVSGAVKGEDELEGRPAILDLPAGRGRVLAFNFNPIHRDLNRSDYRFLWNALLNWSALPSPEQRIDLDGESQRQVVVDREKGQYLGHPTTCLLEDGRTILCVYPKGHGKGPIVYKRSTDGGKTWSGRLPTPKSWETSLETPTIHRVFGPDGTKRLILFSGLYPARLSHSADDGATWSELAPIGEWGGIVVMGGVEALKTGPGRYLAMFHDDGRYFGAAPAPKNPVEFTLLKTFSEDGGLTWSFPEAVLKSTDLHLCEPGLVRSPDGKRLAALLRENSRRQNAQVIVSDDEGKTWSSPRSLPDALNGDRHTAKYSPDGRLLISFRSVSPKGKTSPYEGDWAAWVGTFDDVISGRPGQYLVRLKDNLAGADCAYPGVEILPDGTFVLTTYGHWTPREEPYILSVRLTLAELDARSPK